MSCTACEKDGWGQTCPCWLWSRVLILFSGLWEATGGNEAEAGYDLLYFWRMSCKNLRVEAGRQDWGRLRVLLGTS